MKDPINSQFYNDSNIMAQIEKTQPASKLNPSDYAAVLYVGGHGVMWDFVDDEGSIKLGEGVSKSSV